MKGPPQMTDADYRHATLAHQLAALENARELIDRTIKNLLVLRQIGCSALGQGVEGSVGSDRSDECPNEGVARAEVVVNAGGRPGHGASDSADPVIHAQHVETGRIWTGPRSELPYGYAEVCTDAEYAAQVAATDQPPAALTCEHGNMIGGCVACALQPEAAAK